MHKWREENNTLVSNISFRDFKEVIRCVDAIANIAEEQGHHPDMLIHGYNQLRIILWSHDAGGVTEKDHALKVAIDDLLQQT